jgi:hypothetical protein
MAAKSAAIRPISKFFKFFAIRIIGITTNEPKTAGIKNITLSKEKGKILIKKALSRDGADVMGERSFF